VQTKQKKPYSGFVQDKKEPEGKLHLEKYTDLTKKYGGEIKAALLSEKEESVTALPEKVIEVDIEKQFREALSEFKLKNASLNWVVDLGDVTAH